MQGAAIRPGAMEEMPNTSMRVFSPGSAGSSSPDGNMSSIRSKGKTGPSFLNMGDDSSEDDEMM